MKRFLTRLMPCLLFFCLLGSSAYGQYRIATVDLSRVFTNYWKFKQANIALDDMKAELGKTDREMIESFQKEKENYQKLLIDANNQAVSAEEREKRRKAAEDKLLAVKKQENAILEFERGAKERLAEQIMRIRDNLLTEVRAAINSRSKAGGYTLVLDLAAMSGDKTPVILFSTGEDITDSVLAQLNAGAPVAPATAR